MNLHDHENPTLFCHISLSVNNKEISVPSEITFSVGMTCTVVECNSDGFN
jgi:hypothetical protein